MSPSRQRYLLIILSCSLFSCRPKTILDADLESRRNGVSATRTRKHEILPGKNLAKELEGIYNDDQSLREELMVLISRDGVASGEVKNLWKKISAVDSLNLIKVKRVLDKEGWLGTAVVGKKGNAALFLVIQHSDKTAREQYLPMMVEAVRNKDASPADLALLEDRLALDQGKKQRYGSQIGLNEQKNRYYVLPIEDPDYVDERRRRMGLDSMKMHVSKWGLTWN